MLSLADRFKLAVANFTDLPPGDKVIARIAAHENGLEQVLMYAIVNVKRLQVIRYLEAGADPNALVSCPITNGRRMSCTHLVARDCYGDTLKLLLKHGADINAPDGGGMTPLHHAVAGGHQFLCDFLLEHQANPHLRDKQGNRPFDCSAGQQMLKGNPKLQELLNDALKRYPPSSAPVAVETVEKVKLSRPLRLKSFPARA